MTCRDVFNWYCKRSENNRLTLSGDLCMVDMRSETYISDKQRYVDPGTIRRKDKEYMCSHPSVPSRECLFMQKTVQRVHDGGGGGDGGGMMVHVQCVDGAVYRLVNMDRFFQTNEDRKQKQLSMLYAL